MGTILDKKNCYKRKGMIYYNYGKPESQRRLPSYIGGANPPDERKEGMPMITYSELIETGIFIVALVSLCYKIFKDKRK